MNRFSMSVMVLAFALACGDDDSVPVDGGTMDTGTADVGPLDGGPVDDDADVDPDAGPRSLCPGATPGVVASVSGAPRFAVVGSDYTSTTISVLGMDGAVLAEDWITSGTMPPGLTAALSGDVTLGSWSLPGTLAVVDRASDVVGLWCFDGSLVGQIRPRVELAVNPYDAVIVSESSGWITRWNENAEGPDRGSDLVGFDPSTMTLDGRRVDLSSFSGTFQGGEDGMTDVRVVARPARMIRLRGALLVALERLPENLTGERASGPGVVVRVNLDDLSMTHVELPELRNCGNLMKIPERDDAAMLVCGGYSDLGFFDEEGVASTAGFARVALAADGGLTVERRWTAGGSAAINATSGVVVVDEDRVLGVVPGPFPDGPDMVFVTHLETGAQTAVLVVEGSFVIGQGARVGDMILFPEATTPSVRRLGLDLEEQEAITVGMPALPPRMILSLP